MPSKLSSASLIVAYESFRGCLAALPFYPGLVKKVPLELDFHDRLISFRKASGHTRQALAELVEMHICQIRRYQSRQSQPALDDAIRKPARTLRVSADLLGFARDERCPGDDVKLPFEGASHLDPEEKNVIRSMIESMVLRNTVKAERRFTAADSGGCPR